MNVGQLIIIVSGLGVVIYNTSVGGPMVVPFLIGFLGSMAFRNMRTEDE